MPKINVYLPQDLYDEVQAANLSVSALLQDYLTVFLPDRKPGEYERLRRPGPRPRQRHVAEGVSCADGLRHYAPAQLAAFGSPRLLAQADRNGCGPHAVGAQR